MHFFLSDLATGEFSQETAGLPGGVPENWTIWTTPDDFDGISLQEAQAFGADGADALCVVVATFDHQSILDTGNCAPIPS